MGNTKSRIKEPNNPFELEQYKREQYELEYQRVEKEERRKKKLAEKEKRRKDKMANLKTPAIPFVPKKSQQISDIKFQESHYDLVAKRRMQDQLACDSHIFVLNQVMLSVQFFEHYEREMWEAVERNRKQENSETNKIEKYCKIVILPDRLHEAIGRRVKFQPRHGPNKMQIKPLHTQTLYVVHENIEVTNPGERSIYSIITDAPIYKMEIESSSSSNSNKGNNYHPGYVRLKSTEVIRDPNQSKTHSINGNSDNDETNSIDGDVDDDDNDKDDWDNNSEILKITKKYRDSIMIISKKAQKQQQQRLIAANSISLNGNGGGGGGGGNGGGGGGVNGFRNHRSSVMFRLSPPSPPPPPLLPPRPISLGILNTSNQNLFLETSNTQTNRRLSVSSASTPSTEYDYAYITALNTKQPLSVIHSSTSSQEPFSTTVLPGMCISTISIPSCPSDEYDADADDDHNDNHHDDDDDDDDPNQECEVKQYLNSKAFLAYFINVFSETLANDFGISKKSLNEATWRGSIIYSEPWEIIPAIACPWPNEAFEWMHRHREMKENPMTLQKFQWPTKLMVNKVVSFGCLVVPLGYAPKSTINPYRELEWKIVFPEAERYLESCLSSAQIKVYIITKALLKTFVEPNLDSKRNMFTMEHLRAHLFWQCEQNYAAWPEDYLGEALLRFLNSLLEHIKRQRLPDYFLPDRNLFENIPQRTMIDLHRLIFRITENPVMHVMIALRNLKFSFDSNLLTTQFDYRKLYSAMTIDNPLKILNPNFRDFNEDGSCFTVGGAGGGGGGDDEDEDVYGDGDDVKTDAGGGKVGIVGRASDSENETKAMGAIGYYQNSDMPKRRKTRKVRFLEAELLKEELEKKMRKESKELIDVTLPTIKHMEQLRRFIIYEQFINHYIQMATQSIKFKSYNQSIIYLKQASRLCSLMADDDSVEQSKQLLIQIEELHTNVINERNQHNELKPQLPRRESSREPSNKTKFRVKAFDYNNRNKDYDPYTNIEILQQINNNGNKNIDMIRPPQPIPPQSPPPPTEPPLTKSMTKQKLSKELAASIRNQIITNIEIHSEPTRFSAIELIPPSSNTDSERLRSIGNIVASPKTPQKPIATQSFFAENYDDDDDDNDDDDVDINNDNHPKSPVFLKNKLNGIVNGINGTNGGGIIELKNGQFQIKNQRNKSSSDTDDFVTSL